MSERDRHSIWSVMRRGGKALSREIRDNPVWRISCLFGLHARSRRHAHQGADKIWHSECRRCGREMIRDADRNWVVKPKAAPTLD